MSTDAPRVLSPTREIRLVKNALIPMSDNARLAAALYLPAEALDTGIPTPVVLDYIPYRKDEVRLQGWGAWFYERLVAGGYAVARVDIRGTGGSDGVATDEYVEQEQLDGCEVIAWLAQQPWCDGNVAMTGLSYAGCTSLQVAACRPPALKAIVPLYFTDDRYRDDCHYRGGLMRQWFDLGYYGTYLIAYNAMPPDPAWSGERWATIWEEHLASNEPYLLRWMRHQTDGPYWRQGSVGDIADRIECPVFLIGGWRDGYPTPPLRLFEKLRAPRKLLVGPWNHALPDIAIPGPRINYLRELLRWLDQWCKDIDTGIASEPPVTVYMQESEPPSTQRLLSAGHWRAERSWPPPEREQVPLYVNESGTLIEQEPVGAGVETLDYVPTVGITGGLYEYLQFGLPGDQRADEAFSLTFTSRPLDRDLTILGQPLAILHVSTSASVIGFATSLSDVAADGSSHLVAKGMLNGTRRRSFTVPEPLSPGEIYELEIPIDATGWVFKKGQRIRLSIANADWPNVWPTPELARSELHWGAIRPSRLLLPVVPEHGSGDPPAFVPSPNTIDPPADAVEPPTWQVATDLLTGATTVTVAFTRGYRVDEATVIERDYHFESHLAPSRPDRARARGRHRSEIKRPGHTTSSQAEVDIQASATHFHVTIDLELTVNGTRHFQRSWVESINRQLL